MQAMRLVLLLVLLAGSGVAQPSLRLRTQLGGRNVTLVKPSGPRRTIGTRHMILHFEHTPGPDEMDRLAGRHVRFLGYLGDSAYVAAVPDSALLTGVGAMNAGALRPKDKISSLLPAAIADDSAQTVVAEFYSDVDMADARAILNATGLLIEENPDLLDHDLLITGTAQELEALAAWDEVAYVFPASSELVTGTPVHGCAGAVTTYGPVGQMIAQVGDGWDGPGQGAASLTLAFENITGKLPSDDAKAEIRRAFLEWAKYAKLTFSETNTPNAARTIAVLFGSGAHGDPFPFDGPGGVLAHTFYPFPVNPEPLAGDMHFDDDESWRIGADIDLFSVALHEAGHALGLGHSDRPGAVMYPYYTRAAALTEADISAILNLYAEQDTPPVITPPNTPESPAPPTPSVPATPVQPAQPPAAPQPATPSNPSVPTPPSTGKTAPTLTVLSPATTTLATSRSSLQISGAAVSEAGIAAVTWRTSNGDSGTAAGTLQWTIAAVPLLTGSNTITIRATDVSGNTSWRSLVVNRQ